MIHYVCRRFESHEWPAFKSIRLEALQTNPEVFGSTFAQENTKSDSHWQAWVGDDNAPCFGLFHNNEVIGCTGIVNDMYDPTNKTAVLIASYINRAYRGKGLSDLLYKARITYVKSHKNWSKIIVSHRADNEASKRANQRHGFTYTHSKDQTWSDGKSVPNVYYKLELEQ